MTTCKECKYATENKIQKGKYYCDKEIYENKNRFNVGNFGCVRGYKK